MLNRKAFQVLVSQYLLLEREGAWEEALAEIGTVMDQAQRRDLQSSLERLRAQLGRMDLSGMGWPPKGSYGDDEDLLHADSQKSVSAVIRFVHPTREARLLK